MSRWTDLATWRGPTANQGGRMTEWRGLVIHIAEGYFEGTIDYQKNPAVNVSSHFIVSDGAKRQGVDGEIAQLVDTDIAAWTQQAGNGKWLSVECAGFTPNKLTTAQCESIARLFARMHTDYGVPLQVANTPDGMGLGHHSMGCNWPSGAWGHCDCPGGAIIAQKPAIVARAMQLAKGLDVTTADEVWAKDLDPGPGSYTAGGVTWTTYSRVGVITNTQLPDLAKKVDALATQVQALAAQVQQILDLLHQQTPPTPGGPVTVELSGAITGTLTSAA